MIERFTRVRQQTEKLTQPLTAEDLGLQAIPETSPLKWHLAHTTWFFETFLLQPYIDGYQVFHERFEHLFNSYYNGVGEPFPRPQRGVLSRPSVSEVFEYRSHVDEAMQTLLDSPIDEVRKRIELGLHHEQQHQELMLTDVKYNFSCNPLLPAYREDLVSASKNDCGTAEKRIYEGGLVALGVDTGADFAFDNETPCHKAYLQPYALSSRLVTNGEYLAFVEDGGYQRFDLWLSDGWATVESQVWTAPLYWRQREGSWYEFTLSGEVPLRLDVPVVHLSAYEADAYARWAGARLPLEAEWENAAATERLEGNFVESDALHPLPAVDCSQLFGDVWEWTSSAYSPYPGFKPLDGALGEYNGKFMANQLVLRGGSCATPREHIRPTYRNFFYPPDRWQFSGLRLAYDV